MCKLWGSVGWHILCPMSICAFPQCEEIKATVIQPGETLSRTKEEINEQGDLSQTPCQSVGEEATSNFRQVFSTENALRPR